MANVKNIFNYIQSLNPTESTVSSLGSFVSNQNREVSDNVRAEVLKAITDKNSLACKIASTANRFSEKQLWVIAFELQKNLEFAEMVENFYDNINRREAIKREASRQKLANNKANSQSVLDYVKEQGRLLKDYYAFVKSSKNYKKEFFSKKYTMESAEAFLAQ